MTPTKHLRVGLPILGRAKPVQMAGMVVVPEFEGECNRCGQCCVQLDGFRCEHLMVGGQLGQPEATRCGVYDRRFNGMPIVMVRRKTGAGFASTCWKDSLMERGAILLKGLGRGCSLRLKAKYSDRTGG